MSFGLRVGRFGRSIALVALIPFAPAARAQDHLYEIYNDPVEFERLSGAAQNLLIAKFGPRPRFDEKGNPTHPIQDLRRGQTQGFQPPSNTSVLGVLGNVLVNDAAADLTAQDTQSETALVPGAGSNLICAFNDSGAFLGRDHFTGWAYSSDGGQTWTDPGILPGNDDGGDPVLAHDNTTSRTYLCTLSFGGVGNNVFRSDDDGFSWMPPVNAAPGSTGFLDKPWIAVDNFPGAGNGNVYLVTRGFVGADGVFLYRSIDQGAAWGPLGGNLIGPAVTGNVQGANVVVGANHDVYVFWYDANSVPAEIRMRKSTDLGLTFGFPITVTTLVSTAVNGNLSLVAGFRSNSFPQVAVNPVSGNIYLSYNDPVAAFGGDRGNVFLRQSIDGGATWNAPLRVNDDDTARAQYFPAIACLLDGTGLAVCWYDNRGHAADEDMERWGATATLADSTITFSPNFRISPRFPPVFGVDPVVSPNYMGDYDQMASNDTAYYTTWGDNRDNSIAVPSRKNANVRFASFGRDGPGPVIDLEGVAISGGNGNGRVEFDECNTFAVTLKNNGSQAATGITALLSTTTLDVTILGAVRPYPDLAPGDEGVGAGSFLVSTSPAFECGTTIHFVLDVTYSGGSQVIEFDFGGLDYAITVGSDAIMPGFTDVGNHGDDVTTGILLPFPVIYYDAQFTSAVVSSNGNLQFTGNSTSQSNVCFPITSMRNVIAANWDDMRTDASGGGIFTRTTGTPPNRVFHIEWRTKFSGPATANFELRLHEDSSSFEIVYGVVGRNGFSATIGCQRDIGSRFTEHSCYRSGSVRLGTMLSFSLPACPVSNGECNTSCQIVCPEDVTVGNDPGECGALVEFPAPSTSEECGVVTCTPASGSFFPVGTTTVICSTEAGPGCSFRVTVEDREAPTCLVSLDPDKLWPPNHKLRDITAMVEASDNCPGAISLELVSITSSEPDDTRGDGDRQNDIQFADFGTADTQFELRAERSAPGSGRVYRVTYTATDAAGNTSLCAGEVRVEHDSRTGF